MPATSNVSIPNATMVSPTDNQSPIGADVFIDVYAFINVDVFVYLHVAMYAASSCVRACDSQCRKQEGRGHCRNHRKFFDHVLHSFSQTARWPRIGETRGAQCAKLLSAERAQCLCTRLRAPLKTGVQSRRPSFPQPRLAVDRGTSRIRRKLKKFETFSCPARRSASLLHLGATHQSVCCKSS